MKCRPKIFLLVTFYLCIPGRVMGQSAVASQWNITQDVAIAVLDWRVPSITNTAIEVVALTDGTVGWGLLKFAVGSPPEGSVVDRALLVLSRDSRADFIPICSGVNDNSWDLNAVLGNLLPTPGATGQYVANEPGVGTDIWDITGIAAAALAASDDHVVLVLQPPPDTEGDARYRFLSSEATTSLQGEETAPYVIAEYSFPPVKGAKLSSWSAVKASFQP